MTHEISIVTPVQGQEPIKEVSEQDIMMQQKLQQAWDALQAVPSYVERDLSLEKE